MALRNPMYLKKSYNGLSYDGWRKKRSLSVKLRIESERWNQWTLALELTRIFAANFIHWQFATKIRESFAMRRACILLLS